jgi:ribosomal-protein-alanine N-acetyltransferase
VFPTEIVGIRIGPGAFFIMMEFIEIPQSDVVLAIDGDATLNEVVTQTQGLYKEYGFEKPWIGYLVKVGNDWVGTCAFKSPPRERRLEIAYFTFPPYQGKGIATQMVQKLIAIAKEHSPQTRITAHTLPQISASTNVLKKNGFLNVGRVHYAIDGDLCEWSLPEFEEGTYGRDGCGA